MGAWGMSAEVQNLFADLGLETDVRVALRQFAAQERISISAAIALALREFLIASGNLELEHELDEDTETVGEA